MPKLLLHETAVEQWKSLVADAGRQAQHELDEELESYLVFTLLRFMRRPHAISKVVAFEYLLAMDSRSGEKRLILRDIGDQCLLVSGLYPELAKRRLVASEYFIDMGRNAYDELSGLMHAGASSLYRQLAEAFYYLRDVLYAIRCMQSNIQLQPSDLFHTWQELARKESHQHDDFWLVDSLSHTGKLH